MPELPEVERFRQILLPLVNHEELLKIELYGENFPRKWVPKEDVDNYNKGKWCCIDVLRKGKLLCMVLEEMEEEKSKKKQYYFFLHMGMTGRVISPTMSCSWGHKYLNDDIAKTNTDDDDDDDDDKSSSSFPPRFTYLILSSGTKKVAFADPRKFGSCYFSDNMHEFSKEKLAPDALLDIDTKEKCKNIILNNNSDNSSSSSSTSSNSRIMDQRLGIKAILLDQKRVVSGVGNWVADEVLYQCHVHPDQQYLSYEDALNVLTKLQSICAIAVSCLQDDKPYPDEWLFLHRWTKKKAGKDYYGRSLTFLTSGGRTSAIVASIQKQNKQVVQKREKEIKNNSNHQGTTTAAPRTKKKKIAKTTEELPRKTKEERNTTTKKEKSNDEKKEVSSKENVVPAATRSSSRVVKRKFNDDYDYGGDNKSTKKEEKAATASKQNRNKKVKVEPKKKKKKKKKHVTFDLSDSEEEPSSNEIDKRNDDKEITTKKRKTPSLPSSGRDNKTQPKKEEDADAETISSSSSETKATILSKIDQAIKDDYRRVGFAKWSKTWLPVIQLGPYDIPPGSVRDEWMKNFRQTKKAPRMVYWYGSDRNNLSNAFSIFKGNKKAANTINNNIIGYQEGMDLLGIRYDDRKKQILNSSYSKTIQNKLKSGKKLTGKETLFVNGLQELCKEMKLPKSKRLSWI